MWSEFLKLLTFFEDKTKCKKASEVVKFLYNIVGKRILIFFSNPSKNWVLRPMTTLFRTVWIRVLLEIKEIHIITIKKLILVVTTISNLYNANFKRQQPWNLTAVFVLVLFLQLCTLLQHVGTYILWKRTNILLVANPSAFVNRLCQHCTPLERYNPG